MRIQNPYCSPVFRFAAISKPAFAGSFSQPLTTGSSCTITSTWPVRSPFSSALELSNERGSKPLPLTKSSPVVLACEPSLSFLPLTSSSEVIPLPFFAISDCVASK